MPVSRYGTGYTPSYSPSYFSLYSPSSFSSSSSFRNSGSTTGGAGSRAGTPSRSVSNNPSLADADRRRELRNYVFSPVGAPAAYKYFSRAEYYNTTAIYNHKMGPHRKAELRTVKTDDLNVDQQKDTQREHAIPGQIKRDTAAVAGGKQVIRLVTTKLKQNPYNVVGQAKDQSEMTLGQKLAMKYTIKDPGANKQPGSQTPTMRQNSVNSEDDGSDWTWETCSDSDPEGVDSASISTTKTAKSSTTVKTVQSSKTPIEAPPTPVKVGPKPAVSTLKIDAHTAKWLNYKLDKPSEPATAPVIPEDKPVVSNERRMSAFSRLSSYTSPLSYTGKSSTSSASSSNSQDSPKTLKKYLRTYTGAGSKTLNLSDSEDESNLNIGWRKGQPPRSDVVVKLTKNRNQNSQNLPTAAERVANKILVGPIHKINRIQTEPKLPPLKYATQHTDRVITENFTPFYSNKNGAHLLETIKESSICPNVINNKAFVTQISVKQGELELEEAMEQQLEQVDEEVAGFLTDFKLPNQAQVEHRLTPSMLSDVKEVMTTTIQSKLAPSPQPVNPFITPKLPNMSVKPPDLVKPQPTNATAVQQKPVKPQPVKAQPVNIQQVNPVQPVQVTIEPVDKPVKVDQGAKKKKHEEDKKKVVKKPKTKAQMPDLIPEGSPPKTSEEKMNEMIQNNQLIPKEVFEDIIIENKNLPSAVIAEIPMVKAAIEYNFKHEDDIIASQLERIPTPFRKFYEAKNKGAFEAREVPAEKPKYWNNAPKPAEPGAANPFLEMSKLRSDVKKHKEEQKAKQRALEEGTEEEPEDAWYKDESDEFQMNLKDYHHRMSDHNRAPNEKRTPAENMAIIKIYGGIQFPNTELEETPSDKLKTTVNSESSSLTSADAKSKRESLCNFNEPPVKARPKFQKYGINDFKFLKVLGKGSFGKVLLSELMDGSQSYYAIKCLKKDLVLEDDDIECTMIERKVLALGCKHPFICHLFCTFQTTSYLFFVMEYLNGGDLMFHIQQSGKFDLERAKFYSAEILLALKFLHRKGIVYRDLKLDNVLLDFEGHVRLADFGMCKLQIYLDRVTDTFCGTPDYMAPEIIKGLKYNYCVDWWSFGVLLYEMLLGQSPFNGCDEDELFWSICNESAFFPKFLTKESKHIIQLLLEKEPSKRLGVKGCSAGEVADQPFFKNISFDKLERKQVIPPFKPNLLSAKDVSYFDSAFTEDDPLLTPLPEDFVSAMNQQQFKGFSYTDPNYTLPAI